MKSFKRTISTLLILSLILSQFITSFAMASAKTSQGETSEKSKSVALGGVVHWLCEKGYELAEKELTLYLESLTEDGTADEKATAGFMLRIMYDATDISIAETLENTKEILAKCDFISNQIVSLNRDVTSQIQGLKDIILQQSVNKDLEDIRNTKDMINDSWDDYIAIQETVALKDGQTEVSPESLADAKAAAAELMTDKLSKFKFDDMLKELNNKFTRGDGTQSLFDKYREVLKANYPFEHQIYPGMVGMYNYSLSMQTQLITLYKEYVNYIAASSPDGDKTAVALLAKYNKAENLLKANTTIQVDEAGITDLDVRALDTSEDPVTGLHNYKVVTQPFTFSDNTQEQAYFVKLNSSGERYAILPEALNLKKYFKYDQNDSKHWYDYSPLKRAQERSLDGRYEMISSAEKLGGLSSAANKADLLSWLKTSGALNIKDSNAIFVDDCHYASYDRGTNLQYLIDSRNVNIDAGEAEFSLSFENIYKNTKTKEYSGSGDAVKYGDSTLTRIYEDNALESDNIVINDKSLLPHRLSLTTGTTLDLSKIYGDMDGKTVIASGNCTIIGGGSAGSLTNFNIELQNNSNVTLSSLSFTGEDEKPAIEVVNGSSTITLVGSNSAFAKQMKLEDVDDTDIYNPISNGGTGVNGILINPQTSLTINGDGGLYAKGSLGGAGIDNLGTLNVSDAKLKAQGSSTNVKNAINYSYGAGIGPSLFVNTAISSNSETPKSTGVINFTNAKVSLIAGEKGKTTYSLVCSDSQSSINKTTLAMNGSKSSGGFVMSDSEFVGPVYYDIKVKTKDKYPNGTDSRVEFSIFGTNGRSDTYVFSDYIKGNALQNGSYDSLTVKVDKWLGDIDGIYLKNPGIDGWTCSYVDVFGPESGYKNKTRINVATFFANDRSPSDFYYADNNIRPYGISYNAEALNIDMKAIPKNMKSKFKNFENGIYLDFKNNGALPGKTTFTLDTKSYKLDPNRVIGIYEILKGKAKLLTNDVALKGAIATFKLNRTGNFYMVQASDKNISIDYSKSKNWLALPKSQDKSVDVFYLYPTAWQKVDKLDPNICAIDNASMMKGSAAAYDRQVTAFENTGNIYAPYYRQADAGYTLGLPQDEQDKVINNMPTKDSVAAFEYYIKHYNKGRPFILAGHSQGSNVLVNMLSEYMKKHPDVQKRMVAAYVIGYSVTDDYMKANPHLKFAEGPDDTGVIISYNTQAPAVEGKNPVVLPGALVINPITWTRADTLATAEQNLGSLLPDANLKFVPAGKYADAKIDKDKGVIICSTADVGKLSPGNAVFPKGVFHSFDWPFYYMNLRENAAVRTEKFLSK